ncbi:MAG: hypothetical protein ACR2HC_08540, partial [Thermoleophilaceae bacterium]
MAKQRRATLSAVAHPLSAQTVTNEKPERPPGAAKPGGKGGKDATGVVYARVPRTLHKRTGVAAKILDVDMATLVAVLLEEHVDPSDVQGME